VAFLAQTTRPIRIEKLIASELSNYLSRTERIVIASVGRTMPTFLAENIASKNDAPCVLPSGRFIELSNGVGIAVALEV
jgi:hypothetical protein